MDAPLHIDREEFRKLGYQLVDALAEHFDTLDSKKITPGQTPKQVKDNLSRQEFPAKGHSPAEIVDRSTRLLMENSLFAGHPRFWGYIIGSGTQIGAMADMLAAAVNPNVGGWEIAPMASEIEREAIDWIRDWIDFPDTAGGILVSGGAMANYIGFLTGRRVMMGEGIRSEGLLKRGQQAKVYCSAETHTWVQKAADLFGLGTDAIEWIPTDASLKMDIDELQRRIGSDRESGMQPIMVIGTAGSVSTGVVDDLAAIAAICREQNLWFHIDGAYGAPAAGLPDQKDLFDGFWDADSIALDPHKWLYCPQEAGCAMVKNKQHLLDTFSYRPPYYHFEEFDEEPGINFYEYGFQNSRGFRALKVWMGLLQAGKEGLGEMISHDMKMARLLYETLGLQEDFEVFHCNLSITTFRFVPDQQMSEEELNTLNRRLMVGVQMGGEAFITNAVVDGKYLMRACFVNFRTTADDVLAFAEIVRRTYNDQQY